jgi:hypothetical protein
MDDVTDRAGIGIKFKVRMYVMHLYAYSYMYMRVSCVFIKRLIVHIHRIATYLLVYIHTDTHTYIQTDTHIHTKY